MAAKVAITDLAAQCVQEPVSLRAYVIVTVRTDAGLSGVGEISAGPDPRAALARVLACRRHLLGQDATAAEVVRQSFLSLDRRQRQESAAVQAAVNMALLDILGQLAQAPVYALLGGPTRHKARALAWLGPQADLKTAVQQAAKAGFRAFVIHFQPPQGPVRGRTFYRQTLRLLEELRTAAGEGTDFVLDCDGRLTPAETAGLAAVCERFHLLWLEEPVGGSDRQNLAKIAAESVTPLGYGRTIGANRDFLALLRQDALDILRPDIGLHGLTSIRKAAALAETYYVAVAPSQRGGPVATAAALQLAASIPNFFIQEIPYPVAQRDRQMRRSLVGDQLEKVNDGFLALPSGPGLGITLNQEALRQYQPKL